MPYDELLAEVAYLKAELAQLRRLIFGQKRERWVKASCELLNPLSEALRDEILRQPYLMADETPMWKNYLFAGSHAGARRAALIYSWVATAKRHEVEPFAYLKDVLSRIADYPHRRVAELLPQNWKAPSQI
ncbi:MAG: transposase domain-containing protein [candidate division KSB1 bacterium]|nr:transposase domain-containing protein [candidate division KSB1 bacterium]MDZ7364316.1 transposase domain-containing protein [candidate division KSB1 bacterium]MDZ7402689.1 transposase domain-containing protein [candidate division KSB1 bacterium]